MTPFKSQLTTSPILQWFEPSGPLQRAVAGWNAEAAAGSPTLACPPQSWAQARSPGDCISVITR